MGRITERELILPALYVIANKPEISTSELITELTDIFRPTGEDAAILTGRRDTKFSQIVRNLVAHHTIDQEGLRYVVYEHRDGNGHFVLTKDGEAHLLANLSPVYYLLDNRFRYPDLVFGIAMLETAKAQGRKLLMYDEDTPIFEGRKRVITRIVAERSQVLRNTAIEYYSIDGHILCEACDFDFWEAYGEPGKGFIEIHHKKPLFQYEDDDFELFLSDAVKRVSPLCSNCHRIVHRSRDRLLDVRQLRKTILHKKSTLN